MSDFDREAERERLREKYEQDEQKRKHSERMSELLLKGATMTNVHCEECGDPIFRYDGQEFCPTCQREVGAGADASAPDAEAAEAPPDAGETEPDVDTAGQEAPPGSDVVDEGVVADAGESTAPEPPAAPVGSDPDPADERPAEVETSERATGDPGRADAGREEAAPRSPRAEQPPASRPAAGDGDLAEARAALVRTLADAARRAEETTDPRTRRDHLAAAREAAEALSALR